VPPGTRKLVQQSPLPAGPQVAGNAWQLAAAPDHVLAPLAPASRARAVPPALLVPRVQPAASSNANNELPATR
jgi:hypothetical protein